MRDGLLPGDRTVYEALTAAGISRRRAVQLQNLAIHCGYGSFGLNRADAELCVATRDLSRAKTLALVRAAAEAGHTVYIPWNTSVGGRMRAGRMNGNFARRQCAWKRCCARKSRKARFITANCAAGKALCLPGK